MAKRFDAMQESQAQLQSSLGKQLKELKELTKKTALMQLQPSRAEEGGASGSTPATPREEVITRGRTNTVKIPPSCINFPVSMLSMQIQVVSPLEANLAQFPLDLLQEIHQQVGAE